MRALAATSILVFHVWQQAAPGGVSVDLGEFSKFFDMLSAGVALFFVLSGFLLFRPYVAAAIRGLQAPSIRSYLRNRLLRIGPAYLTVVVTVVLFFDRDIRDSLGRTVANLFLVQYYVPAYVAPELHQGHGGIAIIPSWSLAVEVVFYLLLPLLGVVAIRAATRRGINPVAASLGPVGLMIVLGLAGKVAHRALLHGPVERVWDFSFLTHADWFAWGMALAVLRVLWEDGRLHLPNRWRPVSVAVSLVIALAAVKLYYSGVLGRVEAQSLIAFSCSLLVALVVLDPRESLALRLLCSKPLVATGLASYSLFLWHDPLLREFRDHGLTESGPTGFAFNLVLVGACAAIASTLTYRYVEKPALAKKRGWQHVGDVRETAAGIDLPWLLLARRGMKVIDPQPTSLLSEVSRIVQEVADHPAEIAIAVPEHLQVSVDPSILREIVSELVRNAVLYGRPPITVSAEVRDGSLELTVEDHGRGVRPEFIAQLFEPFTRSEASSAAAPGAGLGLAVAHAYATIHHGSLDFEPVEPHGAAFRLVLPTGDDHDEPAPTSASDPATTPLARWATSLRRSARQGRRPRPMRSTAQCAAAGSIVLIVALALHIA